MSIETPKLKYTLLFNCEIKGDKLKNNDKIENLGILLRIS